MLKRKGAAKGEVPSSTQFGRYRVLSALGQGAMATVHLAEDPSLNRLVAIKVIHSHLATVGNLLDRFTVEAKTAASLRCPNIVEIFDYGLQDGQQYLVMEYIDGPNLQLLLNSQNGKPLEAEVCAAIICQAAEGLMAAEKNNVVHRDIKPENMMFSSEGSLKIADFGIAHINEQNLTQTGSILGSPNFMSPEQIEGGKPTPQTDMFSLGAVFYYGLTGRKPFTGNNIPTIMRNICDLPHPAILEVYPEADPVLAGLVDTLLEKKPENRGKGARWLAMQLRSYLNHKGVLDLKERVRTFLQEGSVQSGDSTMVEPPRAEHAPIKKSAPSLQPLRQNPATQEDSFSNSTAPEARGTDKRKYGVAIIAGVGVLVLAVAILLVANSSKKHPETDKTSALAPIKTEIVKPEIKDTVPISAPPKSDTIPTAPAMQKPEKALPNPGNPPHTVAESTGTTTAATAAIVEGSLTIISAPPFSEVFIDNKYSGTTPFKKSGVPIGHYRVQVSHRNFRAVDTAINIKPGGTKIKVRLNPQQ